MAKLERELYNDFSILLDEIEKGILKKSPTATLEESSDFIDGDSRCSVRVFERYSTWGGNRVSLNITLFQAGDGPVKISAIAAGGSQAVMFKINTFGESSFLDTLKEILD